MIKYFSALFPTDVAGVLVLMLLLLTALDLPSFEVDFI